MRFIGCVGAVRMQTIRSLQTKLQQSDVDVKALIAQLDATRSELDASVRVLV